MSLAATYLLRYQAAVLRVKSADKRILDFWDCLWLTVLNVYCICTTTTTTTTTTTNVMDYSAAITQ